MTLVGCFITPHPPIIVPEVGGSQLARVEATVAAMKMLGAKARELVPDTLVIMSPHAPLARGEMGVSLASRYTGSLAMFRAPQVALGLEGDLHLGQAIMEEALGAGVPCGLLADPTDYMELDHGSTVPLSYLVPGLAKMPRLVVLAFSHQDLRAHVVFGKAIARAIGATGSRVLYIASGDLSHRLTVDAPGGYEPRGADFDRAVVDALARGDESGLLSMDPTLVRAAGECGYRSLIVMLGLLDAVEHTARVLSYEGPFGVGYLVAEVELSAQEALAPAGKEESR